MLSTLKDQALKYAENGLAVLPLEPNGKRPLGALVHNGLKDATTDPSIISKWWDAQPDANIGIATGRRSGGLFVIDIDLDEAKGKNGFESLEEWQKEHTPLPETAHSITGRGGMHLFFRDAANCRNRANLYPAIDIRGENGYIVAPPSVHQNGRRYEWEAGYSPYECGIAQADSSVLSFLEGPRSTSTQAPQQADLPEVIPEGGRVSSMISLVGSLKYKGLGDEAIKNAVMAENEAKCQPPLTLTELEKEVFPSLSRGWKVEKPYTDAAKDEIPLNSEMITASNIQEKAPEYFIPGFMPKYQITTLAGDGGSGKTTVWCAIAAAASSGRLPFICDGVPESWQSNPEPCKVFCFSAEDTMEHTLKRRLRKNGANLDNILSIDISDDRFQHLKFNDDFLRMLLDTHRPGLCIFDPLQAFLPPKVNMGARNDMRDALSRLIGYGKEYGCTFLIIMHSNKKTGVWGRNRMADSADMWDISRSVIMAGETQEDGVRYLSQEKNNYGPLEETIMYRLDDEVAKFIGYTSKKDKDFVLAYDFDKRQKPALDEAKEFILDFLKDGTEKEVSEIDGMAKAMSISDRTMQRAKAALKKEQKIKSYSRGFGKEKKFLISLRECENLAE